MMMLSPRRYGAAVAIPPANPDYSWIKFDETNGSTTFTDEVNGALTTTDPDGILSTSNDFLLVSGNSLKVDFDAWTVRTALPKALVSRAPFDLVGTSIRFSARFVGGALSGDSVSLFRMDLYNAGSFVAYGFQVNIYKLANTISVVTGSTSLVVDPTGLIAIDTNYDFEVKIVSASLVELWLDGVMIGSDSFALVPDYTGADEFRIFVEPAANITWLLGGQVYLDNFIIDSL